MQNEYYKYMARYLKSNDNITDVVAPSSVGIQDALLNSLLIQLSELNDEKITKDYSSNPQQPGAANIRAKDSEYQAGPD